MMACNSKSYRYGDMTHRATGTIIVACQHPFPWYCGLCCHIILWVANMPDLCLHLVIPFLGLHWSSVTFISTIFGLYLYSENAVCCLCFVTVCRSSSVCKTSPYLPSFTSVRTGWGSLASRRRPALSVPRGRLLSVSHHVESECIIPSVLFRNYPNGVTLAAYVPRFCFLSVSRHSF